VRRRAATAAEMADARNTAVVPALQAALAAEHAAVYGYGVAGAHMRGHRQGAALRAWNAHRAQRDQLIAMLVGRGARPVAAAEAYRLPYPVASAQAAARLAAEIEDGVTRACAGLVALAETSLRIYGARVMQDCAVRAATWRGATVEFPGLPHSALVRQPRRAAGRETPR
jgi:Domain of unknown function (DUF4439)